MLGAAGYGLKMATHKSTTAEMLAKGRASHKAKASSFKKVQENFYAHKDHRGDYLTLEVHKNCEHGDHYRIAGLELQMYQSRAGLVAWLRWCADKIEQDLP
jgi:hypothetical protein